MTMGSVGVTLRPVLLSLTLSVITPGQPYTISTFAGGALPVGRSPLSASLGRVSAVAVDSSGDLFFVSSDYNAVFRLDASSQMVSLFAGSGTAGFSGDNGPAVNAQFAGPPSIAVNSAGIVYIADSANNRIRKVTNGVITTAVGTGAPGFAGDGGPALNAILNHPTGLSIDAAGNLYFADSGNFRIRKVSGGVITTIAGIGTQGYDGEGGLATAAHLNAPAATTVDSAGNFYFVDSENVVNVGAFSRILKVANGVMNSVLTGPFGALNTTFALAGDAAGNLYIADSAFHGVLKLTTSGLITGFAGNGTSGFSGDGGLPTSAQMSQPSGIAVDSTGALFIADRDNYRIRKASGGVISTVVGNGTLSFAGDGGPAAGAQLYAPTGVAMDAAGNIYLADSHNYRVRKIAQGVITTVAGNGTFGSSGDTGPATNAQLVPQAVAVDTAGNLFLADSINNCVREVSNGVITTVAGNGKPGFSGDGGAAAGAQLNAPSGVAVDSAGILYIADTLNFRIRKVSNGIITTFAGGGAALGDNGPATNAQLNEPSDVAVDAAGNLYIADQNGRVREVSSGIITTVAGDGSAFFPLRIAVDSAGNLYFTENSRVSKVTNGTVATIAGTATPGFTPDGAPAAGAPLGHPTGIAVDSAGNVYVADSLYNRVRILKPGPGPSLLIGPSSVVNAASFAPGTPLVPGSIATVFGTFPESSLTLAGGVPLPDNLAGLSIAFDNGMQAPLFAVTGTQVNFQVPWELGAAAQVSVLAAVNAQTSAMQSMSLAPFAPGLFTVQDGGMQVGAVLDNATGILIDSRHPAIPGSTILQIYGTGFGSVTFQPPTGAPALADPLSRTTTTPVVSIGYQAVPAQVLYSGLAPGLVGVYQVDALVPAALQCSSVCFLPLTLSIGGAVSNSVSIAVQ